MLFVWKRVSMSPYWCKLWCCPVLQTPEERYSSFKGLRTVTIKKVSYIRIQDVCVREIRHMWVWNRCNVWVPYPARVLHVCFTLCLQARGLCVCFSMVSGNSGSGYHDNWRQTCRSWTRYLYLGHPGGQCCRTGECMSNCMQAYNCSSQKCIYEYIYLYKISFATHSC